MLPKKWKNAQFLLKSQESAQECWKCKIVPQIRKSVEKVLSTSEKCLLLGTIFQNTCGGGYLHTAPRLRARTPVTTYTRNMLSQKSRDAVKGSVVRIKGNKQKGKNMNKNTKLNRKKCANKTKMATSRFKPKPWPHSKREAAAPRRMGHATAEELTT